MSYYKVIDDFLSEELWSGLHDITQSIDFAWYFSSEVALPLAETVGTDLDQFYFIHNFVHDRIFYSKYSNLFLLPITEKLFKKNDFIIERAKCNLFTRQTSNYKHGLHVDLNTRDTLNAIYYINTNNGPTEFEDGTQIKSIKNRLLLFNNNIKHRSVNQTDTKTRINLNINFINKYDDVISQFKENMK